MSTSFALEPEQDVKLEAWDKEHLRAEHGGAEPYCGAIGGRLTFSFTGTSLGLIVKVRCGICHNGSPGGVPEGASVDLTDYGSW